MAASKGTGASTFAEINNTEQFPTDGNASLFESYSNKLNADANNDKGKSAANVNESTADIDNFARLRTVVDGNTDVFRYGLQPIIPDVPNNSVNISQQYEDPTILGFTLEIDEDNSPLFQQLPAFLQRYSANNAQLAARITTYENFKTLVKQIFKSQESAVDANSKAIYIKSHYINTVSGLGFLGKKSIKYMEDKLSVELHEDIQLTSTLLASLYQDLVYDYETGRNMIPINLTKFILRIKISEVRNFTSFLGLVSRNKKDFDTAYNLKYDAAAMVYTLYDCDFDFSASQAFQDSITQSGVNANLPNYSALPLSIFFKSSSRIFRSANLLDRTIDNSKMNLTLSTNNQKFRSKLGSFFTLADKKATDYITQYFNGIEPNIDNRNDTGVIAKKKQEYVLQNAVEIIPNYSDFDDMDADRKSQVLEMGNVSEKNIGANISKKIKQFGERKVDAVKAKLLQKRAELLYSFIGDINRELGIKKIVPANVYEQENFAADALGQLKSLTGFELEQAFLDSLL